MDLVFILLQNNLPGDGLGGDFPRAADELEDFLFVVPFLLRPIVPVGFKAVVLESPCLDRYNSRASSCRSSIDIAIDSSNVFCASSVDWTND